MKQFLVMVIILLFCSSAFALTKKDIKDVDINAVISETQVTMAGSGDNHMALVWWIPIEYWEASVAGQPVDAADRQMFDTLRPYYIVGVVQADIGPMAGLDFYSQEKVLKGMDVSYVNAKGKKSGQLALVELEPDLEMLINILKPILGASMGQLGQNFHFYVFKDTTAGGKRMADPYSKGELLVSLSLKGRKLGPASVGFPLDSLYVPRKCPNGKDAHVSWKYCPWSGKKLKK